VTPPDRKAAEEAVERAYHRCRDRLNLELHKFVLSEEEETLRLRRRLHIHICLLGVSGLLTFLSMWNMISIAVVTGSSVTILTLQEWVDYIGRF
jgi:hypothetical protein